MKFHLCFIALILLPLGSNAQQEKELDSTAIFILDKMSDVISQLHAVNLTVETSIDRINAHKEYEKHYATSNLKLSGPNKLAVQIKGDTGHKGYWYDGAFISYYDYDENNYVTLEAPDSTITMIDSMHEKYDFQFPAADFFYPTFVDDLIENFDTIVYLGQKTIDNIDCYNIMCVNEKLNVQIWISNEEQMLPRRFVMIHKDDNYRQYEATFKKWELNPMIPDAVFNFVPPPKARLISILAKS